MFGLLVLLAGFGYCLLLYVCLRLMLWFASCLLLAFTGVALRVAIGLLGMVIVLFSCLLIVLYLLGLLVLLIVLGVRFGVLWLLFCCRR